MTLKELKRLDDLRKIDYDQWINEVNDNWEEISEILWQLLDLQNS